MVRAASDGMRIQVVTLGAVLAGFGLVSHWAIPRLFGAEWMTVTVLYPFVAIGYLTIGLFQPEAAMLNVVELSADESPSSICCHLASVRRGGADTRCPGWGHSGMGGARSWRFRATLLLHLYTQASHRQTRLAACGVVVASVRVAVIVAAARVVQRRSSPVGALLWPGYVAAIPEVHGEREAIRYAE